ncbi:MAG: hypothetical protein ABFC84_04205 [Veillonellales bacterium]
MTTGEVGSMVREAIKRGSEAVAKETQVENGLAHQNCKINKSQKVCLF